jgi:RNA recognition motif-containing protein
MAFDGASRDNHYRDKTDRCENDSGDHDNRHSRRDFQVPRSITYNRTEEVYKRPRVDGKNDSSFLKSTRPRHASADPNSTLGIFGLNQFVTEDEMRTALAEKLPGMEGYSFKMIVDERTGLCKGFCFVDFACLDDAMSAKDILNSESLRGQDFRCDYSHKHRAAND